MHTKKLLSLLTVASTSLLAFPAAAQMYPGEDVTVNPAAMPGPLQPGQPYSGYTVHKPHHHRPHPVVAKTDAPAAPATDVAAAAPPTADTPPPVVTDAGVPTPPPAKPAKHARHTAAAAQATEASTGGLGFSFGEDEAPAPPPAANTRTAANEQPPAQTEKPSKADTQQAGLAKRGAILFEHNSTDPQPSQMDGIKLLAGDLNSALEAGATQIQLQAFGGPPNDKGSEAKRISLRRALAIRQLLIDNGVPSAKIVTRAMGGATDGGEADRVDIYVRAS